MSALAITGRTAATMFNICANSINDNKYSYNNLAAYYATWYPKFGQSKWHMAWETWYQYCNRPDELTCNAPDWATVQYLNRQFGKKDYISLRNEYFNDLKGQRTGFKTKYTTHTISWNHWIGSTVLFRPELRYDIAYDAPAYDSGLKKRQLMFAADVIWFY
jgi:hypothetical protein